MLFAEGIMQRIKGSRSRFRFMMNSRECRSIAWLPDSLGFLQCNAVNLMALQCCWKDVSLRFALWNLGCGFDLGLRQNFESFYCWQESTHGKFNHQKVYFGSTQRRRGKREPPKTSIRLASTILAANWMRPRSDLFEYALKSIDRVRRSYRLFISEVKITSSWIIHHLWCLRYHSFIHESSGIGKR